MCVIRIRDILKTSGPKNHIGKIKFHAYRNDLTTCSLNCLRQYLDATKQHRGNITFLFITRNKPFKVPSKDTLVTWVKQTLKDAGIKMNIFSPNSTRSACNSKAKTYVSFKTILETRGGGATGRSQGFMTNQSFKKNSIVLVYWTVKNDDLCQTLRNSILCLKCLIYF